MLGEVSFIVWRESVEALLIIGILWAWLKDQPQATRARRFLWGGVGVGLACATGLAYALIGFAELFEGEQQDYFQFAMMSGACLLIVQMVFWLRKHGRTLKRDLHSGLQKQLETANWWGMLLLVALAIAREGSETVIFLYGLGAAQSTSQLGWFSLSAVSGFTLALATFWLLQLGSRILSWPQFFMLTERMLLALAGALLMGVLDRAIGFGWLPPLIDPLWNITPWLSDAQGPGKFLAAFVGYRASPPLTPVLGFALYWTLMYVCVLRQAKPTPQVITV